MKTKSLAIIVFAFAFVLSITSPQASEREDRKYLVERPEGVEMAALQGATDSTFYVATIDAVPTLRWVTVAHGVTPQAITIGSASVGSKPPALDHKVTAAISMSLTVPPVSIVLHGPEPMTVGGDGTEEIDLEKLNPEDLGACGRVPGTGKTRLGIGLFKHKSGNGYSGDAGGTIDISHKDADFYEMAGPFECSKLPFKIIIPAGDDAPADASIEAIMVWFPRTFRVARQKEDIPYADLPKGTVVIGAAMNMKPVEEEKKDEGDGGENASGKGSDADK